MTQWNDPRQDPATQQQYGASYGQPPPSRFADSTANPFGAASDREFGIVSTVLALLGGVLGVVAFTAVDWFSGPGSSTLGDVSTALDSTNSATGFASAYFGWLAWAFLVVAVLAAVCASFPSPALRAFRVIGVVIGFAAAGLSFLALQLTDNSSYTHDLKDARAGFYLAVIAFLLAGIGAAIGPRRV